MCQHCQLVSARVLDDFRGISSFVIFNVTRAILETLPSHMHLVALWSQRAAVKSRHTQQRCDLWLRRLHEVANPWKRFESRDVLINVSRSFGANLFPCSVAWCFASARPWFSVSARDVVGPDPARSIVAQIDKCSQVFVTFFQSIAFSLHAWSSFVFPLSRG